METNSEFSPACSQRLVTFSHVLNSDCHKEPNIHVCMCAVVSDSATPWTVTHRAPLSMEFSRQEYQSGLPFPSLGDLPDLGIKPACLVSPALAGGFFTDAPQCFILTFIVGQDTPVQHMNFEGSQIAVHSIIIQSI